jgi:hypothetical protein
MSFRFGNILSPLAANVHQQIGNGHFDLFRPTIPTVSLRRPAPEPSHSPNKFGIFSNAGDDVVRRFASRFSPVSNMQKYYIQFQACRLALRQCLTPFRIPSPRPPPSGPAYPETRSNDKKALGGWAHIRIHEGVCRGRIACEPPSLTEAYQDMEKIDDVSPCVAAEIRQDDGVPLDFVSSKANVYK